MNLGTFTTIDCPYSEVNGSKGVINEAEEFLEKQLEPHFTVRTYQNPHDFGEYPSFEIDWIDELLKDLDEDDCSDEEWEKRDAAITHFDRVEAEYNKKYMDA